MKKILLISGAVVALTACQTAGVMKDTASKGVTSAFSCTQINAAFSAYAADKTSAEAYNTLAMMTGVTTKGLTTNKIDAQYQKMFDAANVALLVQGCPPMVK